MSVAQMISKHPDVEGHLNEALALTVRHSMFCAAICTSCADACVAEQGVADLRQCIRLSSDCADICTMLMRVATRRTGSNEAVLQAALDLCKQACETCASECERQEDEHCQLCAKMCRELAEDITNTTL